MRREIRRTLVFDVQFDETDMLGVVHNSVYFRWFERGRLALLEEVLPISEAVSSGLAAPVVRNVCEYKWPARYRDTLALVTRMPFEEPYPGKILFFHELSNVRTRKLVAVGESVLTLMDWKTGRLLAEPPLPMLERMRTLLMGEGTGKGDGPMGTVAAAVIPAIGGPDGGPEKGKG